MPLLSKTAFSAALLAAAFALPALAQKTTVCTVTVNSADERDAFRESLPEDKYEFVELVEKGRPDWLASSCRRHVRCDVLVVSGHFAGSEFYTSRFDQAESLAVDEMERVACSDSCPDLFSGLKEVYLFGCDTLKPEPVKSGTPEIVRGLLRSGFSREAADSVASALSRRHGESSRDRMRRVFPDVPVIYGFSSLAPYGRVAGPMLKSYFQSGADEEFGSGRASRKLLSLFAPTSMVATAGLGAAEPDAGYRARACRFYDDRLSAAQKLDAIHRVLGGDATEMRMTFDRVEKFFASMGEPQREQPAFSLSLAALAADSAVRDNYLAVTRDTQDPALRMRMIALARTVGWLPGPQHKAELTRLVGELLAADQMDFGDVDLVCGLDGNGELDAAQLLRLPGQGGRRSPASPAQAAARACLGSRPDRARILEALASPREADVQVAQAYLRHRPLTDAAELRSLAAGITRMKVPAAQARALDALGRLHVADKQVLDDLTRLFRHTSHLAVQRAIAEIFLRAGPAAAPTPELVALLSRHRVHSPEGEDVIDVLIDRLRNS